MGNRELKIAPSILCADFVDIKRSLDKLNQSGADIIHFDAMDGMFVNNITFGPKFVADARKHTDLLIDVHMMIVRPHRYVAAFADAGANIISVHLEAEAPEYMIPLLRDIKRRNIKAGIAISPDTPVKDLTKLLDYVDMVLLMSVHPGWAGQKFLEKSFKRLQQLVQLVGDRDIDIQIDGGITLDNIAQIKDIGANIIVAGNTIFASDSWVDSIHKLRHINMSNISQYNSAQKDEDDEDIDDEDEADKELCDSAVVCKDDIHSSCECNCVSECNCIECDETHESLVYKIDMDTDKGGGQANTTESSDEYCQRALPVESGGQANNFVVDDVQRKRYHNSDNEHGAQKNGSAKETLDNQAVSQQQSDDMQLSDVDIVVDAGYIQKEQSNKNKNEADKYYIDEED